MTLAPRSAPPTEQILFDHQTSGASNECPWAKELRVQVLTVHLEAVLAVAQLAETVEGLGLKELAEAAYRRTVRGFRRAEQLLSSGPFLPGHLETLERLRLAPPLSAGRTLDVPGFEEPPDGETESALGVSVEGLTPRELQVLTLIADGKSSKQLAFDLGISFKTAVCHRYNIMEKLDLHDVSGLVRFAIRNGLIEA